MFPTLYGQVLGSRTSAGAWAYAQGGPAATEPTALAALALRAHRPACPEARTAADWLASRQRPDGALSVSTQGNEAGWPTPYAVLLWAIGGSHPDARARACGWLLRQQGRNEPAQPERVLAHDPSIPGWSWAPQTHAWLEPTALAVLALRRAGLGDHPRVRDGLRLIHDRAIPSGGWNYGNSAAFGHALRPQPAPTGLALVALAGTDKPGRAVARALDYLNTTLPAIRAAASLSWGTLGLRAWDRAPAQAGSWLLASAARPGPRPDQNLALALLLLATAESMPADLLG